MKYGRLLITACLVLLSVIMCGQTISPLWIDEEYRNRHYPTEQWYTGFVCDRLNNNDNIANALMALERDAQNQLAESIIIRIEGKTLSESTSQQQQKGMVNSEVITVNYSQVVQTATTATLVKTNIKSYCDSSTRLLYAFAAVRRTDLFDFYQKQLNVDLSKVEVILNLSEQLIAAGKKISARRRCEEGRTILDKVALYCDLLVAVSGESENESMLQIERSHSMRRNVEQLLIELEQSTFVYVDCKNESKGYPHDVFSSDSGLFCDVIKQLLSENECSVTDNQEEADYELTLITSTTQRSTRFGDQGVISYYANVRGSLSNRLTNKRVVDFSIFNDSEAYAVGRDPEQAASRAFRLPALSRKVSEKILQKIKNQ